MKVKSEQWLVVSWWRAWWRKPVTEPTVRVGSWDPERVNAEKIDELHAKIEALEQERDLAANSARGWMERAGELGRSRLTAAGLMEADSARLAVLAEHAGRASMLAGRVLRYGWDQRREPDSPTLRELLMRESASLIAISKQICGLRETAGEGK